MVGRSATLEVRVTGDASGATRAMDQVSGGASGFQSGMGKAAKFAAIGGAALVAFGTQAFAAASDAEQAAGAVDSVFGKSSKAVHDFAKKSAESTGLASSEYENMAAVFGAQLKNMGVSGKKLAPTTNDLIGLGADLAAQFGGSTADAVSALSSLLRGETDPIERYGVSIKAADVAAKKAEMGLDDLTGAADKQATTQATLALLTEQTASAQGAFGREANTAAGQQARANAQFKNATAELGTALLPVVAKVAGWLTKLTGFISDNALAFQVLVGVLGGAAIAIWAVNAAMAANPATLIAIGVAALIAGIILLVKNWDKVVAVFKKFWEWLKQNWDKIAVVILGPFGVAIMAIKRNWRTITKVFATFGRFAKRIFKAVKDVAVSVFRAIRDVIVRVIDAGKRVVSWVRDRFVGAFRFVRDTIRAIFAVIRDIVVRLIDPLLRVVGFVRDRFVGAFRFARDTIRTVIGVVRTIISNVIQTIQRVIGWVRDRLGNAFRAVRDVVGRVVGTINTAIQTVIDKATALWNYVTNSLATVWTKVSDAVETAMDACLAPIQWVIDKIDDLIGWIGRIKFPSPPSWLNPGNWLKALPGVGSAGIAPAVARVAAPVVPMGRAGFGARGLGSVGSRGDGGVTINVTGALDPDAVARQIERILIGRSRRVGGVRYARGIGKPAI